jgi:hypothetical protein
VGNVFFEGLSLNLFQKEAPIRLAMSVSMKMCKKTDSWIFIKFWEFVHWFVETFQFWLKADKNIAHCVSARGTEPEIAWGNPQAFRRHTPRSRNDAGNSSV